MRLVAVAQALEDLDRVRERGLADLDRLEAPLEGSVLLEVLAVFLDGRRADRLQLAAGQHRLENARRVDCAFGCAGADQGMNLVNEQDDVAAGANLLQDFLQPLLEVTAIAAAGDQCAEVKGVQLLVFEVFRNFGLDNGLRQAFDHGGFAHAGFADQNRIVLRPAGQDLHDPLDFLFPANNRVELSFAGRLGQISAELVEHQARARSAFAHRSWRDRLLALVAAEQLDDLLANPVEVRAELDQNLRSDAFALANEAEQDVLGADVVVSELQRLPQAELEDLLRSWRKGNVAAGRLLALSDDLFDLLAHAFKGDAK